MKTGYSPALRRRVEAVPRNAYVRTEAIVRTAEDVRCTRQDFDATGVTPSNVQTFDEGAVRLSSTGNAVISHTSSDSYATSENSCTEPSTRVGAPVEASNMISDCLSNIRSRPSFVVMVCSSLNFFTRRPPASACCNSRLMS